VLHDIEDAAQATPPQRQPVTERMISTLHLRFARTHAGRRLLIH